MNQVIARTYRSQDQAMAAARELLNAGFPGDKLHLLVFRGGENAGADDEILDELHKIGIGQDEAKGYVKGLRGGETLLAAMPPDTAEQTAAILDRHDPVDGGRSSHGGAGAGADSDPAPLSHALRLKVLSDDPAPLSHLLHIPVLTDD